MSELPSFCYVYEMDVDRWLETHMLPTSDFDILTELVDKELAPIFAGDYTCRADALGKAHCLLRGAWAACNNGSSVQLQGMKSLLRLWQAHYMVRGDG